MDSRYEIELPEPSASRCECCDGLSVRLTRFVERDGDAFAMYFAEYAVNHEEQELNMLISLAGWDEEKCDAVGRVAFLCRVWPTDDAYEVMLEDVGTSSWRDSEIIGEKLSQAAARAHPESPRVSRRLLSLRGWSHGQSEQVPG